MLHPAFAEHHILPRQSTPIRRGRGAKLRLTRPLLLGWTLFFSGGALAESSEPAQEPSPPSGALEREAAHSRLRVALEFQGPKECPADSELIARVLSRSRDIEFVPPPAENRVGVDLSRTRTGQVRAHLRIEQPGETVHRRFLAAESCDEALEALALMIVIVLDPQGAEAEVDSTESSAQTGPTPAPAAPAPPSTPAPEPEEALSRPESPEEAPWSFRFLVGAGAGALHGAAPQLLLGPELVVGALWSQGESPWAPLLRGSVSRASREGYRTLGGVAHFTLTSFTLELCPLVVRLGSFSARPCALGTGGELRAQGTETTSPREAGRPWWGAGASGLFAWEMTDWLAVTAAARLARAGVRDTFEFEPHPFHRVPAWIPSGSFGLEVGFP